MRQDLDRSKAPVMPFRFLSQLREKYPQFAQQGRTGAYSQQDAEECWSQLLYTLRERLRVRSHGWSGAESTVTVQTTWLLKRMQRMHAHV